MRLVFDSLIALMLAAILGGVLVHYRQEARALERLQEVHQALARLQEQALYHGALSEAQTDERCFPPAISPLWFDGDLPVNPFVPGRQPWIDVAPADEQADDPPDPVLRPASPQAGFWYNPSRGVFRARVLPQFNDQETLNLYNRLNGTQLRRLSTSSDPARTPQPMNLSALAASASSQSVPPVTPKPTLRGRPNL